MRLNLKFGCENEMATGLNCSEHLCGLHDVALKILVQMSSILVALWSGFKHVLLNILV